MKIAVRYYSRGGNTRKIAEAIAEAAGVPALSVTEPFNEDVDILFLGSAMYAGGVDGHIKDFIKNINVKVGKVVNFSTTRAAKSTYKVISGLLGDKGIPLAEEEFSCKGSFLMLNRGKPDREDCRRAAKFAKNLLSGEN